ncbi:aromatic acid/H+ symport family MFS transporter [soil metagenome]
MNENINAESGGTGSLESSIDQAPISRLQATTYLLCALVMMIEGYDLVSMPFSVPHIVRAWNVAPSGFSIALSAALAGLAAGAIGIAPLGDRFGRRPLILAAVVLVGLATIGTATSTTFTALVIWRFLTGIALGTGLANLPALVAELAPRRRRAGLLTLVSCGIPLGGVGAGLIVPMLAGRGGWQMIFTIPGVATLAIAVLLYFVLPESPKWLLAKGKHERLARVAARLGIAGHDWAPPAVGGAKPSALAALGRGHRFATFVFCSLYGVNASILYGLISWTPTLLAEAKFPLDQTSRLASLIQLGGLVTAPALSWFLDRSRAVSALIFLYIVIGVALLSFSAMPPTTLGWSVLLLLAGGGVSGTHLAIMALGATFYPPPILSSALGFGLAVARVGAIAGPLVGGILIGAGVGPAVFLAALVVPVVACAGLVLLIPRVNTVHD